ncbi:hypothetical protein BU14_0774s0007 [Porphyra umbilicalis]|uniref:Uncharacterized protein n=1 Tax=Porphyra umbilicalis TaxID=2786 RepID=A0A1X6NPT7_PORUM|nr:hypothetical protein BU14_0774s0007 [Porphyra umbilicalis]|eukprot:OSX70373.1 hypothetical protein BU14_0774s0007 [Porphyra umbilicalis]
MDAAGGGWQHGWQRPLGRRGWQARWRQRGRGWWR